MTKTGYIQKTNPKYKKKYRNNSKYIYTETNKPLEKHTVLPAREPEEGSCGGGGGGGGGAPHSPYNITSIDRFQVPHSYEYISTQIPRTLQHKYHEHFKHKYHKHFVMQKRKPNQSRSKPRKNNKTTKLKVKS